MLLFAEAENTMLKLKKALIIKHDFTKNFISFRNINAQKLQINLFIKESKKW